MSSKPKKEPPSVNERALAEIGASQWNDYNQRFVPLEESYKTQVSQLGEKADELGQIAATDIWQTMDPSQAAGNPQALNNMFLAQGQGLSDAVPRAAQSAMDAQLRGQIKIAAMGRGLSDQATATIYDAGRRETQAALERAKYKAEGKDSWQTTAGMAAGAFGKYAEKKWGGNSLLDKWLG